MQFRHGSIYIQQPCQPDLPERQLVNIDKLTEECPQTDTCPYLARDHCLRLSVTGNGRRCHQSEALSSRSNVLQCASGPQSCRFVLYCEETISHIYPVQMCQNSSHLACALKSNAAANAPQARRCIVMLWLPGSSQLTNIFARRFSVRTGRMHDQMSRSRLLSSRSSHEFIFIRE